jgi:DNA repair exonuclease SbcCD ATPase subunit
MEQALSKLEGKVNYKFSLDGVRVIRQQLQKPIRFIESMQKVFIKNSLRARQEIQGVSYNPMSVQPTGQFDRDVIKYKELYERQVEMLRFTTSYENSCMQIKEEVEKMKDLIKRLCEFVEKIDNILVDKILPEVIRRQRWEQMSKDYLKKYREWVNLEDHLRQEFFNMFKFNEVPEVFGQLLLSDYQIPNEEFLHHSEYQDHLKSLNGFFEESKKFYSDWSQNLKEICKTTHVSILRREKDRFEKENQELARQLEQARDFNIDKNRQNEELRRELDDLISKHSTTGNILIDERTKAEDLRNEIDRLNKLCSSQEASIKELKAGKQSLALELEKTKEAADANAREMQAKLNGFETELKTFMSLITEKNQVIDSLRMKVSELHAKIADLESELQTTKHQLNFVQQKLTTITDVKDSVVREMTKLKEDLAKKC